MNTLYHIIAGVIAVLIGAYIIPGIDVTPISAVVLVILLGVINMFFKPIIRLLTLPINILTLGLFSLAVNALIILGLAKVVPDFTVSGFWPALLFSLLVSIVTAFFGAILHND